MNWRCVRFFFRGLLRMHPIPYHGDFSCWNKGGSVASGAFLILLVSTIFLLGFITCQLLTPAHAHDHWINKNNYTDPVFKWRCCGDNDCNAVDPKKIALNSQGDYALPDGTVIDKSRMIPSEDQYDYVCRWGSVVGGSNIRCLFIVAPGT